MIHLDENFKSDSKDLQIILDVIASIGNSFVNNFQLKFNLSSEILQISGICL